MSDPLELRQCPQCGTINRVRLHLVEHATCGACQQRMNLNYYDVLGVSASASVEEIKSAFRRLTLKWHPDLHPDDEVVKRTFGIILRAYQTLVHPEDRARFDMEMKSDVASSRSSATESASTTNEEMAVTYGEMMQFTVAVAMAVLQFIGWAMFQFSATGFADSLFAFGLICSAYGLTRIVYFLVVGRPIALYVNFRRANTRSRAGKYAG